MGTPPQSEPETIQPDPTLVEPDIQGKRGVTKNVTERPELFNPSGAPDMPEARPGAIEAAREKTASTGSDGDYPGIFDRLGNPFDPAIHENDAGVPRMAGNYVRRKRGGGGAVAAKNASQSKVDPTGGKPRLTPEATQLASQIEATAATCTGLTFMMACMIGGPEFKPEEGEPEAMHGGWKAVCERYGMADMPPVAALIAITCMYAGKRWHRPIFKEKRIGWVEKCKRWLFRAKYEAQDKLKAEKERVANRTPPPRPNVVDKAPAAQAGIPDPLGDWSKPTPEPGAA